MMLRLVAVVVVLAATRWATAQGDAPVRDRTLLSLHETEDALARRRLHGMLLETTTSITHEAVPARDAFASLGSALRVPLVVRYADDPVGYGIDPAAPITLTLEDATALDVLEALLAQCSTPDEPCTWQLRKGFVEAGTKRRLNLPAARETRLYHIRDLMFQVPKHTMGQREQPAFGALDVVQKICENVEPGAWDYGQTEGQEPLTPDAPPMAPSARVIATDRAPSDQDQEPSRSTPAGPDEDATPQRPDQVRRYVPPARTAIIRYWRDVLIVHAPDYIHRQINGYPDPIRSDSP